MRQLLYNAIKCPDGTVLTSHIGSEHHEHEQLDGRYYCVSGGLFQQELAYSDEEFTDLSCDTDTEHVILRERFEWGSRGVNGDEPLHWITLKDITDSHLDNLLIYTKEYPSVKFDQFHKVFCDEINYRKENHNE